MFRILSLSLVMMVLCAPRSPAAEGGLQDETGRIVFTAKDAGIDGATDQIRWDYKPTRWGMYDVSLIYASAGPAGTDVQVAFGEATVAGRLAATGSLDRDATLALGRLYVPDTTPHALTVRCPHAVGDADINLRSVTLSPACEGQPPMQADDGSVTLHGRDATVRGTSLRYEPAEQKQTLGFWTRPTDAAEWSFAVTRAATFDVEVLQGCGPGQGGSVMSVAVDAGQPAANGSLEFTVEATGGFQDFRSRIIGRVGPLAAGQHTLRVTPKQIAKQAACDIRQVRLVPVNPAP